MRWMKWTGGVVSIAAIVAACTGGAEIGSPCKTNADCASNQCVTDDPNGQCEEACKVQADCPSGSTCTDESKCYKSCTANADCRTDGYACVDAMSIAGKPVKTCDVAGP